MIHRSFSSTGRLKYSLTYLFVTFCKLSRHINETKNYTKNPNPSKENKRFKAMKTSIIVSSFAALCLMLTFAESPSRRTTENIYASTVSNISYIPAIKANAKPSNKVSASVKSEAVTRKANEIVDDFNYLKFNTADYNFDNKNTSEVNAEDTFEYLKFDVNEFNKNNEFTSADAIELPLNDTEYLKFNVNDYIKNDEAASFETLELPVNNFEYLKFNVQNFITADEINSVEIESLPVEEYSYLVFNVNDYTSLDNTDSGNFRELPVNE
jgi:hypothetical protein